MSKALKRRGFTFVGSTICYAFMQSIGMVNDHLATCPAGAALRRGNDALRRDQLNWAGAERVAPLSHRDGRGAGGQVSRSAECIAKATTE